MMRGARHLKPFESHLLLALQADGFLSILPMSFLNVPQINFFRYFGTNTRFTEV